jgi:hypothetical protein
MSPMEGSALGRSEAAWFALLPVDRSISPTSNTVPSFVVGSSDVHELLGPQDIGVTWIERERVVTALIASLRSLYMDPLHRASPFRSWGRFEVVPVATAAPPPPQPHLAARWSARSPPVSTTPSSITGDLLTSKSSSKCDGGSLEARRVIVRSPSSLARSDTRRCRGHRPPCRVPCRPGACRCRHRPSCDRLRRRPGPGHDRDGRG